MAITDETGARDAAAEAIAAARSVLPIWQALNPSDKRPADSIAAAEAWMALPAGSATPGNWGDIRKDAEAADNDADAVCWGDMSNEAAAAANAAATVWYAVKATESACVNRRSPGGQDPISTHYRMLDEVDAAEFARRSARGAVETAAGAKEALG